MVLTSYMHEAASVRTQLSAAGYVHHFCCRLLTGWRSLTSQMDLWVGQNLGKLEVPDEFLVNTWASKGTAYPFKNNLSLTPRQTPRHGFGVSGVLL